jgi:sigma-B regulation protein RsbU (phosphoserine phosphatase)
MCYEAAWAEAEVGGDFYDIFPLPSNKLAIVVGDVSGKGLAAAAKTAEVRFTLRVLLDKESRNDENLQSGISARVVSQVNSFMLRDVANEWVNNDDDALTFICLALVVIDTHSGSTEICVAGLEPPLIIRSATNSVLSEQARIGGLPIGVGLDAEYTFETIQIGSGETLVLSTDGVTEARRAGGTEMFGINGLKLAAERAISSKKQTNETLTHSASSIVAAARTYADSSSLKDDACVMLIHKQ